MSVQKIFIILIIVVACVIIGALVLNVLMPNATKTLVNAVEDQIYNATKMSFDFNGDNDAGGNSTSSTQFKGNQQDSNVSGAGKSTDVQGIK